MSIYDIQVKDNKGHARTLRPFRGKVLLIVNTATQCELTHQYKQLESWYKKYHNRGLEILDFPCNQFQKTAPENDFDIHLFCLANYGTTFPRYAKIKVNGKHAHPLFVYLKAHTDELEDELTEKFKRSIKGLTPYLAEKDIKWNFTMFLVDRQGNVRKRFFPSYNMKNIEIEIQRLL